MKAPKCLVIDTNVLMDMKKPVGAIDAPRKEIVAAKRILVWLLTGGPLIAYATGMLPEWERRGLFRGDAAIRILMDNKRLKKLDPLHLSGGKKAELAKYIDRDDQIFVMTAAAIPDTPKPLVTRDPKIVKKASRSYAKREFSVIVLVASELATECSI